MVHTNKEINYKESQSRWMERMESGGGGGDAEQDEEKRSGERWTRRARGKEKLISSWSNLSFITLMEKQREQRGARLQKKPQTDFYSFSNKFVCFSAHPCVSGMLHTCYSV